MKAFGRLVLLLVTLVVFLCIAFYIEDSIITSSNPGFVLEQHGSYATITVKSRKLKESRATRKAAQGHDELEDYRPIDPVPSSKASIRPGPIQHGTPLMPFIPKPSPPPGHSKHIGLP